MADKNLVDRVSLTTTLENRYQKQHVGGAYDAKADIVTSNDTLMMREWLGSQEGRYTQKGFRIKAGYQLSDFLDVADRKNGNSGAGLSKSLVGWNNTKYKK